MMNRLFTFILLTLFSLPVFSQQFTKVKDSSNPLASHGPNFGNYTGVSWIDYNNDGWEDCFINSNHLFRNNGDGTFTKINFSPRNIGGGNGNSWGDIDRDGDPDVIIAACPTKYFRNDDGTFVETSFTEENIDTFNFWSPALADYNEDGWLDLYLSHPANFIPFGAPPIARTSLLFLNDGDGTFTRVKSSPIDNELAAFTIGSWSDYDMDGDLDLFVGSGEVSVLSKDHIYINKLSETGTATLEKLTTGPLANDLRDGQNWNWIDYDNDGDLDGFVTNYNPGKANDLYRNDNGTYVKMTEADVGKIADQKLRGLGNLWADFDNDGDLDCFITFDTNGQDRYYRNNGDGTFTEQGEPMSITGSSRGAAAGDYDNDGFLDLMVSSNSSSSVGLYHNEGNSNNWVSILLKGETSNLNAIGAKVRIKATINSIPVWQYREVNAQNSFNGHNSFRVHFGLGDATIIDSMYVEWPLGKIDLFTEVSINQFCDLSEGGATTCSLTTSSFEIETTPLKIFPNPADNFIQIELPEKWESRSLKLEVIDSQGKVIRLMTPDPTVVSSLLSIPINNLPNGAYWIKITVDQKTLSQHFMVQH